MRESLKRQKESLSAWPERPKKKMRIIPIHHTRSVPVKSWSEIKDEVSEMKKLVVETINGRRAIAIHHSQVSEKPFNFFVIHPEIVKAGVFEYDVVINPKLAKNETNINFDQKFIMEGCMSFTLRNMKKVRRYTGIAVYYETPTIFGIKKHNEVVYGVVAQIFQHELEHAAGLNIYGK